MTHERLPGIDPVISMPIDNGRIEPAHREKARPVLKQILDRIFSEDPKTIVVIAELARELGISGPRTKALYLSIARTQQVPRLRSRTVSDQEDFDQKVQELKKQGLDTNAIREELGVTTKLVIEAISRIDKNQVR